MPYFYWHIMKKNIQQDSTLSNFELLNEEHGSKNAQGEVDLVRLHVH